MTIVFVGTSSRSAAELSESEDDDSDNESEEDIVDEEGFNILENSSFFCLPSFDHPYLYLLDFQQE